MGVGDVVHRPRGSFVLNASEPYYSQMGRHDETPHLNLHNPLLEKMENARSFAQDLPVTAQNPVPF